MEESELIFQGFVFLDQQEILLGFDLDLFAEMINLILNLF
jgi:hypothetical protein